MRRIAVTAVVCFIGAVLVAFLAKGLYYYKGIYHPPVVPRLSIENIVITSPTVAVFNESSENGTGTVLVDLSHYNNFSPWEIDTLLSQVAARGFTVKFLKDSADFEQGLLSADAFIMISPQTAVSRKEIDLITQAVDKKMKFMLVEEPARSRASFSGARTTVIPVSEVSARFGFLFERDYLYNLKENDGNYRNVFFRDFAQNELTQGLEKIAFYSAGSLTGSTSGIMFTDENTYSSKIESKGRLSPMVLTADSHVLGIYNLTFLTEPYNSTFDNSRLLANICNWLTTSDRVFSLASFPYFLGNTPRVTYADASLISQAIAVKNMLADRGKSAEIGQYEESRRTGDTVFVGLLGDAEKVKTILEKGNIRLTSSDIEIDGTGTIPQSGTALIYHDRQVDSNRLVILADTTKRLQDTIQLLRDGKFRQWLVRDSLAIYRPDEAK